MNTKNIDIYIQGQRLDLFKDENITINSSVQNINDISRVFTDFSYSFTVPASQNNNKIFQHYYNADIVGGFDARTKKDAKIEISKLPFKDGKIRLESVSIKNGKPDSYKVTFFGNLVSLTDRFGEDKLSSLDLSDYDHPRTFAQVRDGMKIGLFGAEGDVIIYPLLSNFRRFYYNSNTSDHTSTEELVNIAYHDADSAPYHGIKWTEVKPAILVKKLIDTIESKYGLTFSTDFFGLDFWDELYLWLQRDKEPMAEATTGINLLDLETHVSGDYMVNLTTDILSVTLVSNTGNEWNVGTQRARIRLDINPQSGYEDVNYSIYRKIDNEEPFLIVLNEIGDSYRTNYFRVNQNGTFNMDISFYLEANEAFNCDIVYTVDKQEYIGGGSWANLQTEVVTSNNLVYTPTTSISDNMPDMKVSEFFTGIVKMFNLAIIPNSSTDFYINSLDNWYANGGTWDISSYVNTNSLDVARGKTHKDLSFVFEEGETILINERFNIFGSYYGDASIQIKGNDGKLIEGDEYKIELPFEQMVYERLTDSNDSVETEIQYGLVTDDDFSPAEMKPHIFFAQNITGMAKEYGILDQNDIPASSSSYWKVSHTSSDKSQSTVFNNEIDEYDKSEIENTLYNNYYSTYVGNLFSEKRRIYTYKAKLPNYMITNIKLNDRLIINGTRFLINTMEINLTTNETKLELLNDIY